MIKLVILIFMPFVVFTQELDLKPIIDALCHVESDNNKNLNHKGSEVGVLGITPIMVREVNRILGVKRFGNWDRNSIIASREMCKVFLKHQIKQHYDIFGREPDELMLVASWNSGSIWNPVNPSYVKRYVECKRRIK